MKYLLIDNYDSFTYNILQCLQQLGAEVIVRRNDEISVDQIPQLGLAGIIISPGPCTPDKAGHSEAIIEKFAGRIPIFGVCLGMQAIGEVFGGRIVRANRIMHGKTSTISHSGKGAFKSLPDNFEAVRYHSLVVEKESLPDCLEVTATSPDGEIMGLKHRELSVEGVQFHPESILSESGAKLLANWLESTGFKPKHE